MRTSSPLSRILQVLTLNLATASLIAAAPMTPVSDTSLSLRGTVERVPDGDTATCTITYFLTVQGNGHERVDLTVEYYVPSSDVADRTETSTVRVETGQETTVLSWDVTAPDVNGYGTVMTATLVGKRGHDVAPVSHDATCDGFVVVTE